MINFKCKISEDAEVDILEGVLYYDKKSPGLGDKFLNELESSLESILQNPKTYNKKHKEVRGFLMKTYPYAIYYLFKNQEIEVLGVIHTSRKPSILSRRIANRD